MDDAERLIAFGNVAHDDAETENVRQLLEADRLALHLAPDRIGALAPAENLGADAAVAELFGELLLDLADPAARFCGERFKALGEDLVRVGIKLAKRQIFELLAHLMHADAAGKRGVNVERLLRRAPARFRRPMRQGAHVVQPVGKLDEQHPHVGGNGEQELAQILRLLSLLGDEVELFQLGQTLDQPADVMAEHAIDLGAGGVGILDSVVQQRRRNRRVIELEVGEDRGDLQGVRKIRIARIALLFAMGLHGVDIGAVEQILVGCRVVLLDPVDQLVLPHHPRLARLCRNLGTVGRRHQVRAARHRHPGTGLVLHPRQIVGRRARHHGPWAIVRCKNGRKPITRISWGCVSATRRGPR